jgi:hypothetical protein
MLGATPNPLFNQPIYGPDKVVEIKQKADKLYGMKKRAVALGIAVGAALAIAAPVSAQVKPTPISGYPISGYPISGYGWHANPISGYRFRISPISGYRLWHG